MTQSFKIYRIICTLTDKALVSGTDMPCFTRYGRPPHWHERGFWSASGGAFWKTEPAVRKHLQNLCHDWSRKWAPSRYPRYPGQQDTWTVATPGSADWSRLRFLRVEQIYVSNYATTLLSASDFMGVPIPTPDGAERVHTGPLPAASADQKPAPSSSRGDQ